MNLAPQKGPQEKFLSTPAMIAIYGGAAGGGKSFALILEVLRWLYVKGFEALIFRRTTKMIKNPGGLWDEASGIFPLLGGQPNESDLAWYVPQGLSLKFAHMEHNKNMYDWQGSQIGFLGFDELTHFSRRVFFYMIGRLRSKTGIPGYIRATCNPDADSWVAEFLKWWIEQDEKSPRYGLPIPERDGVLRWFIRQGEEIIWGDSQQEMIERYGADGADAISVTFIAARVQDNQILLETNPKYLANLKALDRVERARLLDGNWKIRASAGNFFRRSDFEIVDQVQGRIVKRIRYWDRAATKVTPDTPNPDWTAGPRMCVNDKGVFYVEHVERFRDGPLGNETKITNIASGDPKGCTIGIEQDPAQAGKADAEHYIRLLAGYDVRAFPVSKDKVTRARGYSAQVEAGNVKLVRGDWNEAFLTEHENFPPKEISEKKRGTEEDTGGKDDQVDGASGAFNFLTGDKVGEWVAPSKTEEKQKTFVSKFDRGGGESEW